MAEETRYIRLNPDGTSQYIVESRYSRDLPAALMAQFGQNVQRTCCNAFTAEGYAVNLTTTHAECYGYVRLPVLTLSAHYKMSKDKVLTPRFVDRTPEADKEYPLFKALWKVPETMRLIFAARIKHFLTSTPSTQHDYSCWLMAFDKEGRVWKLPLPNLYDDVSLCMGRFDGTDITLQGAFTRAFAQFLNSDWNSHLMGGDDKNSDTLFQFKPGEKDVECIPYTKDWTKHCPMKAATVTTKLIANAMGMEQ